MQVSYVTMSMFGILLHAIIIMPHDGMQYVHTPKYVCVLFFLLEFPMITT